MKSNKHWHMGCETILGLVGLVVIYLYTKGETPLSGPLRCSSTPCQEFRVSTFVFYTMRGYTCIYIYLSWSQINAVVALFEPA